MSLQAVSKRGPTLWTKLARMVQRHDPDALKVLQDALEEGLTYRFANAKNDAFFNCKNADEEWFVAFDPTNAKTVRPFKIYPARSFGIGGGGYEYGPVTSYSIRGLVVVVVWSTKVGYDITCSELFHAIERRYDVQTGTLSHMTGAAKASWEELDNQFAQKGVG